MVSLGRSRNLLAARSSSWTEGEQAAVSSSFLSGQGTEQMIPAMFSSSLLLALCFANQVHCHPTATGAALKSGERAASVGEAAPGKQLLLQTIQDFTRSEEPVPVLENAFKAFSAISQNWIFYLKIPWALEVCEIFSIAYQAAVLKAMCLAAQPAWVVARWFPSLHPRPSASYPQLSKALKET